MYGLQVQSKPPRWMKPVAGLKIERALICSMGLRGCFLTLARHAASAKRKPRRLPSRRRCATIGPFYHRRSIMKIGMNLLLWTTHVTEEHFPLLAKLKKVGYDGVELPLFAGDAAHYKAVRKELDNHGLGCTTVVCAMPDANPISPDAKVRQAGLDRLAWA